jgi:hypothetical protein
MDSSAVIRRIEARLARWDVERRISEGLGEKLSLSGKKTSPALGLGGPHGNDALRREFDSRHNLNRQASLLVMQAERFIKDRLDTPQSVFLFSSGMKVEMERTVRRYIGNWKHLDTETIQSTLGDRIQSARFDNVRRTRIDDLDYLFRAALLALVIHELGEAGMDDADTIIRGIHGRGIPLRQFMREEEMLQRVLRFVDSYTYATPGNPGGYYLTPMERVDIVQGFMGFITPVVMPDDVADLIASMPQEKDRCRLRGRDGRPLQAY